MSAESENETLRLEVKDYKLLHKVFGHKQIDDLLERAKSEKYSKQRGSRFRNHKDERQEHTIKNRIYDEKNGLWYEKQGDYFIPCLSLPEEKQKPIGIWGQRHLHYIKQHKRVFYANLLTSCKLNNYLADVDEQAENLFCRLVKELSEKGKCNRKAQS